MILQFLQMLLILLVGNETQPKHSLHKQQGKEDILLKCNRIIADNFYIICLAVILLLFIVFVWCCFWIVGLSGTESGAVYNQMEAII